ncbi:tetratricopeptide repeat protein [Xanthobacter sp. TB0136]|uniref:tetratricopeptide repeat protein n=1 Tax=Xanthobacter sp. TB0136 TaxID=3459177 RepID=UPI00403A6E13
MKISRPSSLAVLATALAVTLPALSPALADAPSAPAAANVADEQPTIAGSYLAARFASSERDNDAAVTYLRNLLKLDSRNPEVVERTFFATLMDGDMDDAIGLASRLVKMDNANRIARLTLGVNALRKKQYRTARSNLALSMRGPIGDLTAVLLSGWAYYGANDTKNAIAAIRNLQGPDWYAPLKALNIGLILDASGQQKEAGRQLKQAMELDPGSLRTLDAYARWVSRNEGVKAALAVYDKLDERMAQHPVVEAQKKLLEQGKSLPPLVLTPQQGAAEVLYGLGSTLARQGGEDLAMVYLRLASWLDPEHPFINITLAELYEQLKQPAKAIEVYGTVPASSPLKRDAEIQLGVAMEAADRFEEAENHLKKVVAKAPDDPDGFIALGRVQQARKMFAECAQTYSRAIDLIKEPTRSNWLLFYFRGICNERSKNWPAAEADLKKALELYPDQPHVMNYIGYSWVDQGIHLDEGLNMIRKAVSLRPDDGPIVDSLGWAYYKLGRYNEAVEELERAVELMPQDPVINDHLGDAYWKVGRKLEAGFQWSHARELKPEPQDLAKIERKLKDGLDAADAQAPVKQVKDESGADSAARPQDQKPEEAKTEEAKPADGKPAGGKPAEGSTPADAAPATPEGGASDSKPAK